MNCIDGKGTVARQVASGLGSQMQEAKTSRIANWELLVLGIILGSVVVIHSVTLTRQSFFIDEVAEILIARDSVWTAVFMTDSMPPLFTLLLRGWLSVVPDPEHARWFSVLSGMLTTVIVWIVGRKLSSAYPSLLITAFFAYSPLQLVYSQLIRGYCWFTLLAVMCIGAFLFATILKQKLFWWGFVVTGVLGAYTHYYFAFVPAALLLAWATGSDRTQWRAVVLSCGAMGTLALPVLIFLASDFQYQHDLRQPRPLSAAAAGYTFFSYFSGYALGPSQRELQILTAGEAIVRAMPWIVLVGASSSFLFVAGVKGCWSRGLLGYVLCLTIVPFVVLGTVGAVTGITYNVRHLCWITFPISVLLGNAAESDRRVWWRVAVALASASCFAIFGVANYQRVFVSEYQTENTRGVAQLILSEDAHAAPIFVVSDYLAEALRYYLPGRAEIVFELPQPGVRSIEIRSASAVERSIQEIRQRSKDDFWFVYSRSFHGDPDGLLLARLMQSGIEKVADTAGVVLFRGKCDRLALP